jgi:hypothetical protein
VPFTHVPLSLDKRSAPFESDLATRVSCMHFLDKTELLKYLQDAVCLMAEKNVEKPAVFLAK